MAVTHQFATRVTRGGVAVVDASFSKGDAVNNEIDATIGPSQTNFVTGIGAITRSKIVSVAIVFDRDATLKTNSTTVPAETWAFKAGVPLTWTSDMPTPCPFSVNLTEIYVTTGVAATACKIYIVASI